MAGEGLIHIDVFLTNVSNQVRNEEYIADAVAPMVPVVKQSDRIVTYGSENIRVEEDSRPNKSVSKQATFTWSFTSYLLERHALKDIVTDQDRMNYDAPLNAEIDATEALTDRILLRREVAAASMAFNTATWGTNVSLTSTTSWRYNSVTTDPAVLAHSAASSILLRSAKRPNTAVIGFDLYQIVRDHISVLDRIKYTQIGMVTPGLLAALWDVEQLVIGTAIRDAGIEGISSSNTAVWNGQYCLFAYVEKNPGLKKLSAAYTFYRGAQPFTTKKWRMEEVEGDAIEVQTEYCFKPVATIAAYLVEGANV